MLASRLASDESIEVISMDGPSAANLSKPIGEAAAMSTAAKLKADYVSYGTVTVTNGKRSHGRPAPPYCGWNPPVVFSQTGKNQGDALQQVKLFAAEILKALGSKAPVLTQPVSTAPAATRRLWMRVTVILTPVDRSGFHRLDTDSDDGF